MSIAFVGAASGAAFTSPLAITVPAQVLPGDVVLAFITAGAPGATTLAASTSGRTVPALAGPQQAGPATRWALFQFSANQGDAGAVLAFTSATTPLIGVLAAYRGAGLVTAAGLQPWTAPSGLTAVSAQLTPPVSGSWGIAFAGVNSGAGLTYAPGTARVTDGFDVSALYDSAAPQSPVGGGTWTTTVADVWWGYTAALPPAAAASSGMLPVFAPAVM